MIRAAAFLGLCSAAASADVCTLAFEDGTMLEGVALAETVEEQTRGLSGVDTVGAGMLFVWPDAKPRIVWMRDTRIPLSAAFISGDGLVFRVANMEPMADTFHHSGVPAQYVLEVARGELERHGLRVGSRLVRRVCERAEHEGQHFEG